MSTLDSIKRGLGKTSDSLESVMRMAFMSKVPCRPDFAPDNDECVILANGPSLSDTIKNHLDWIMEKKKFAVNFMANSEVFSQMKPDFYILADPHFFIPSGTDLKVDTLWDNIHKVDWKLVVYVPVPYKKEAEKKMEGNVNIIVKGFNLTPIEGWNWFSFPLYKAGLGMPRPRNVLIPALMMAIQEQFRKIYVAGADHSWPTQLWVDDDNCVVSIQPHFYPDDAKEKERVREEYKGHRLHDIFGSFAVALRSYFDVAAYAKSCNVEIINVTPGSFIDAFPREKIEDPK